ncbi:hypothetical protein BHE74_00042831 [Ensete ventricosum]|nr:hypothetical protein GW17_00036434 [Ensete ventricosum]RWW50867.1 hypothetical protein BHE74_00042831 [Ensete ventricosum]RZR89293.1 hypothetical protein BHM03_00017008 [Ensete ventricosum]
MLQVPIKRERLKSLCHMIVSLKVLGQTFQSRGPDMIRSLPHIINIIQVDIEQLILPSKYKLQAEVDKGSQMSKLGFLNSLARGKMILLIPGCEFYWLKFTVMNSFLNEENNLFSSNRTSV